MSEENKEDYKIEDVEQHADDREYMLQAIENDATWVLAYASEKLKADKDLMMKCAEKDGQILYYTSEQLRDDKEFVLKAVSNKWLIIKYVSYRLRSDKDVALCALKSSKKAKEYLTKEALEIPEVEEFLKEDNEETKWYNFGDDSYEQKKWNRHTKRNQQYDTIEINLIQTKKSTIRRKSRKKKNKKYN